MKSQKTIRALQSYKHAIVAVDSVIFAIKDNALKVLLLKVIRKPFTNKWVVPGGLVLPQENLEKAVSRHITNKTGLSKVYTEQLYTFGEINRDPRGRVVSVAYVSLLADSESKINTIKDYSEIQWFDIKKLPALGYDHKEIISNATKRLGAKIGYTNIAQYLLPDTFTLSDLQTVYQLILGHSLDKRNFRKKILSLDIIENSNKKVAGSFRPAALYHFKTKKSQIVEIL